MIHRHTGEKQHKKLLFSKWHGNDYSGTAGQPFSDEKLLSRNEKASGAPEKYFASSDILCVSLML